MNRLKELRKEKKLTQKEMAEELEVPYRSYQRWENEEVQIKPDTTKQLADYFNVSIAYLMGFSDSPDGNDKPTGFDSVEEYEKARKIYLDKYVNNPNSKQIGIAHGVNGKEKLIPNIGAKKDHFSQLIILCLLISNMMKKG